jgi:hypothetical protein
MIRHNNHIKLDDWFWWFDHCSTRHVVHSYLRRITVLRLSTMSNGKFSSPAKIGG